MPPPGIEDAIKNYFWNGYEYATIHYLLDHNHNFAISFRKLKDVVIPSLGLKRRHALTADNLDRAITIAKDEIKNGCNGAEALRRTLMVKHHFQVPRCFARDIVSILDEDGIRRRSMRRLRRRQYINRGPNYVWHIDGYDKLKPYGLPIHGCIDGFSRRVVWLVVGTTNQKSDVVAGHYIKAVENAKGFPVKIRADPGTENVLVARMQRALADREHAFIYGPSTSNQRIERFWGLLRQYKADFWIDHFKNLMAIGIFDRGNGLEILCIQYAYIPYIQQELDHVVAMWNTHTIRQQHVGDVLSGIPELMFRNPELTQTRDYLEPCRECEVDYLKTFTTQDSIDADFKVVADEMVQANGLVHPTEIDSVESAKQLFVYLKQNFARLNI